MFTAGVIHCFRAAWGGRRCRRNFASLINDVSSRSSARSLTRLQADEGLGVRREQRQPFGDGRGSDHQVGKTAPWLAAGSNHSGDAAVDPCGFGVERDLQAASTFRMLVVCIL